jgi:hypothetical protein
LSRCPSFAFQATAGKQVSGYRIQVIEVFEFGIGNAELNKVKCLIFIPWPLSPACRTILSRRSLDNDGSHAIA